MKFKRGRVEAWTREKIESLSTLEVRQLGANATRLAETEIRRCARRCSTRGRAGVRRCARSRARGEGRRLMSRAHALGLRGVTLRNRSWSRGGVRQSDGAVVFALWAEDVQPADGASNYLLWAPNVEGSRPWSDTPGGQERLEHCRLAAEGADAEGLLVYGERMEGTLPDDKALSVQGADPYTVLTLRVEKRAEEYWATWGGRRERRRSTRAGQALAPGNATVTRRPLPRGPSPSATRAPCSAAMRSTIDSPSPLPLGSVPRMR